MLSIHIIKTYSFFSPRSPEHVCCWWSPCHSAITQVCFWVSILRCSCTTRGILFHRALSCSNISFLRRASQIWRKKLFPCPHVFYWTRGFQILSPKTLCYYLGMFLGVQASDFHPLGYLIWLKLYQQLCWTISLIFIIHIRII